jgi:uncharacterized membrane-anchored protein YhcB (DUF1043 family)
VYSLTTLVVTGVLSLLIGGALGAYLLFVLRGKLLAQDLEMRAASAETELNAYQRDVATHFTQTSELINDLNVAYKNMHEHLASGALKLATPAISRQIIDSASLSDGKAIPSTYLADHAIEPPRDWAPKTPGSKGVLSEDYGLHDDVTERDYVPTITESIDDYDFDNKSRNY